MTTANAKQLAAIEAVAAKVNAIENELVALEQRTSQQAVALCVALWRHTCRSRAATPTNADAWVVVDADGDVNTTAPAAPATTAAAAAAAAAAPAAAKRFAVDTAALRHTAYDLRMGTHWRDEALMQALFALDNVFGDDAVKAKRKEQVTRIKALIARAEHLRIRNRRLDALLKRLPMPMPPVSAASAAADEPAAPAATAAASADANTDAAEVKVNTESAAAAADASTAEPMDTTATPATPAAAAAEAPARPATPPAPAAAAAAEHVPMPVSALDVKHSPAPAAAAAAAAPAPAVAATRPASPAKAEAKAPRPATPPKAAAAAAAAAAASDDDEAAGFVIPAKVKAQWPRLRVDFDTRDAGDSIQLSAALPGVLPQDLGVSLSADNSVLTVRGLKRPTARPQRRAPAYGWFGAAYGYEDDDDDDDDEPFGWFEEQFSIPARLGVDASKAERILRAGRLTVILPRKPRAAPAAAAASPRCGQPSYAPYASYAHPQPQYYRQPQASPFGGFGGYPFFRGRPSVGGWF